MVQSPLPAPEAVRLLDAAVASKDVAKIQQAIEKAAHLAETPGEGSLGRPSRA